MNIKWRPIFVCRPKLLTDEVGEAAVNHDFLINQTKLNYFAVLDE